MIVGFVDDCGFFCMVVKSFLWFVIYNGSMARPSKFSKEIADRIIGLVAEGYCVKSVAAMVGISDTTIMRLRLKDPAFNKVFLEATARQWENASRIRGRGLRSYRRPCYISPNYYEKPHTAVLRASQGYNLPTPKTWMGLPIKKRSIPYVITPPYLNEATLTIEWIDEGLYGLVLHSCSMAVWWRKHQPNDELFIGSFI